MIEHVKVDSEILEDLFQHLGTFEEYIWEHINDPNLADRYINKEIQIKELNTRLIEYLGKLRKL